MNFLKNLHPDIRDNNVSLNEINHEYNIEGETNYLSVTTFCQ